MLALLIAATLQAGSAADARQLTLAAPQTIAEVDTNKMKGEVARLAWSPDGSEFYIQTVERDRRGAVKSTKHYMVSAAGTKSIGEEPAWASKYWRWKSDRTSPSSAAFAIAAANREDVVRSTAAPNGGVMARGGVADPNAGTTVADVASAAEQTQMQSIWTLKVKNETIGEWVNEPVTPGVNFSWAPAPLRMIAFTRREGGPIVVLDDAGNKQELTAAKVALFPAWSDDGKRIAWLERKDKKKYTLTVAEVAPK